MHSTRLLLAVIFIFFGVRLIAQYNEEIVVGALRTELYFPLIKGKNVALVANHTSIYKEGHLVDTLLQKGIGIVKVFSPEHGFRGKKDAGEKVGDQVDLSTGLPIISLYGDNKKPSPEQMEGVEVVIFDIQDVGARFYTYISTMHYVMEASAEAKIPVIILDRPNPNGHYIDGPLLDKKYTSFVGMHPVPIVHGMTVGEYARMINGEGWLDGKLKCDLRIIPMQGYDHTSFYKLPVKPSPNLPNMKSVYLYPSLCLFEGTLVSIGRGTDYPFQIIGHPDFVAGDFEFVPRSIEGASKYPKLEGRTCLGINLSQMSVEEIRKKPGIQLNWLINFYNALPDKKAFYTKYFNVLAGSSNLRQQIEDGMSESEIKKSWAYDLNNFRQIRSKYLLYADFEQSIKID